jgi:hypothetical protein
VEGKWLGVVRARVRALMDALENALTVPRPARGRKEPTMPEKGYGSTEKEINNQKEGRSGSGTPTKDGPAVPGSGIKKNPTQGGGINRPTAGKD